MATPFDFEDYRAFLSEYARDTWGAISRLAKAAGCQRSYLSRALQGQVLLTPDHLYGICEFLKLGEEETDYLLLLLEKDRAASAALRERVNRKLKRMRRDRENLSQRLKTPRIPISERELVYYSAWHWCAVHLCTSIVELQTEKAIAQALYLPVELVRVTLRQLADWGLVRAEGSRWVFASGNLHLPKASPIVAVHHDQWRRKACEDSLRLGNPGLHYTQVQAMEEGTFQELKRLFLETIDQSLKTADPAKEEMLVAVNLDVFRVSPG